MLGQLVFVLAVMAAAFVGAKLGLLTTRDARASHNFTDVPDSAFYHDFVQFLVDNAITAGCSPGLFCGEQSVTRGQAAVFLKKLVDTFEVVRNPGDFTSQTAVTNAVNCPAGKRALAGGGTTNAVGLGLFLTQINLNAATVGVRWESASPVTGQSEAWALCASA